MAASSRASRSAGTGGWGKARSRASRESGDRSGFGRLWGRIMGNLVTQQSAQAVQGLRGTPFHGASRFVQHGSHHAIAQTLQVVQHEQGTLRGIEFVESLVQ